MSWKDWLGLTPSVHGLARALLQRAPPPSHGQWHYDRARRQIRGDHGMTLNLANIYNEYVRAAPGARPALLQKYLALMLPEEPRIPRSWTLARRQLYVVVRSRYDHALATIADSTATLAANDPVQLPWVGELCLKLAYDLGPSLMLVERSCLHDWAQSPEQALEWGLRNLTQLTTPRWVPLASGVYRLDSAVAYEESLLLVDRVAERLPVAEGAVFLPVNRGILLACDGTSPQALATMLETARQALIEQPWPMAATLLHKVDGTWQEFTPSGTTERKAQALKKINSVQIYNSQQEALQQHYRRRHDEVSVAAFQLRQASGDEDDLQSFSSWLDGTAALLPRTDCVALRRAADEEAQSAMVPWEQMLQICGHRLHATQWEPPRFRADEFPSAAEWEQLLLVGRDNIDS